MELKRGVKIRFLSTDCDCAKCPELVGEVLKVKSYNAALGEVTFYSDGKGIGSYSFDLKRFSFEIVIDIDASEVVWTELFVYDPPKDAEEMDAERFRSLHRGMLFELRVVGGPMASIGKFKDCKCETCRTRFVKVTTTFLKPNIDVNETV